MGDIYGQYSYKRYRPRRRIFGIFVGVFGAVLVFFGANLVWKWVDFGAYFGGFFHHKTNEYVTVEAVSFFVRTSEAFEKKSSALDKAAVVKAEGGSGYVIADGAKWRAVIDLAGEPLGESEEYRTARWRVRVEREEDRELVALAVGSFEFMFEAMMEYERKFVAGEMTRDEIKDHAWIAYQNLVDVLAELEARGGYKQLCDFMVKELVGVGIIWLHADGADFRAVLKNAGSWVIFALYDLTKSAR